jgi:hypothetical protein
MLQIIVQHTHLVICQYAHDAVNNGKAHISTYTTIMSIHVHTLSVKPRKKKRLQGVSFKETFKGTNKIQHFCFALSLSIYLMQYEDLAQPEVRVLYELVGTLNV